MQISKRIGNYVFSSLIGKGSFAEVYRAFHQSTKSDVAIKMIPRSRMPKQDGPMIEKEVNILLQLQHTNIVQLIDFQKTLNNFYLIFEYCKYGDLDKFIHDYYGGRVPENQAQKIIQQIIEGIKFMKQHKIVHRDLKLANLLVAKDFIVKIADFGFARYANEEESLFKSYVGTPLTMAPEILERKKYSEKCDVWSLGIIFYQILVGKLPFDPVRGANAQDLLNLIKKKTLEFPIELEISSSVKELIKKMLVIDQNHRINFEDLFNHEWITGAYQIQDPLKLHLQQELNASILLKSAYDKKRLNQKRNQQEREFSNKPNTPEKGIITAERINLRHNKPIDEISQTSKHVKVQSRCEIEPANNLEKATEIDLKIKLENLSVKDNFEKENRLQEYSSSPPKGPLNNKFAGNIIFTEVRKEDNYESADIIKWKEIYKCLLLSKIYEILEQKCENVITKLKKIGNVILNKKIGDVEESSILPVLVIMQMLGIVKDLLNSKINVFNEKKQTNLIDLQLRDFWDNFTKIKGIVMKFNGEPKKYIDIYKELKSIYDEYFKKMQDEMAKLQPEKFKGFDAEELLYDSLIHLSENTALNEFISEKKERIDQYLIVDLICEIILYKKNEVWYELEVVPNDKITKLLFDAGIKLQDITDKYLEYLTESFTFDFAKLTDILQKEENVKIIRNLKDQFVLKMNPRLPRDDLETLFINKIKILHQEIRKRIIDLSE